MLFYRRFLGFILAFSLLLVSFVFPFQKCFSDAVVGESVITLGNDLTKAQKDLILKELGWTKDIKIITVTNEEEHKYLDSYLSTSTIGSRAISSAKITIVAKGKGIAVKTKNISSITESMYANAAITAGIKDADIIVTAPFKVSGTAGLTGIIKAFEEVTGQKIDENKKKVANEEMVRTSELAQLVKDPEKAAKFMNRVKEKVAKENPQTLDDYKNIILNVSNEFNIHISHATMDKLVVFLKNFSKLDIDWNSLNSQLQNIRTQISDMLSSQEAKGFINKVIKWLGEMFYSVGQFFSSISK